MEYVVEPHSSNCYHYSNWKININESVPRPAMQNGEPITDQASNLSVASCYIFLLVSSQHIKNVHILRFSKSDTTKHDAHIK